MSASARRPVSDTLRMTSVAALRRAGRGGDRRLAQGDHDGQVVGDDVVHLAGDPGALGRDGERGLLVSLSFQPVGAVAQLGEVGAAGGDVQAEAEGGGDQARTGRSRQSTSGRRASRSTAMTTMSSSTAGAGQRVAARLQRRHGVQGDEQRQPGDQVAVPQTAGIRMARIQPNTGIGQIRRTTSGAAITASTTTAAARVRRCGGSRNGAPTASGQHGTQHVGYPAPRRAVRRVFGWRGRHARNCPPRSGVRAPQPPGGRATRTTAYPHSSAKPVQGDSACCSVQHPAPERRPRRWRAGRGPGGC